jgi:hypothetical protein
VKNSQAVERAAVDELLRINHEDYSAFKPKNDRQRVQALRWLCIYICGRVAGTIDAAYAIATMPDMERQPDQK